MLSFIIPAYNEESLIAQAIQSIHSAVEVTRQRYEIIVVDDASTDRTAAVAQSNGARVMTVHMRHIAAVRNAGVRQARGDVLIFLDADTILPESTLLSALEALDQGAVGGGCHVMMDDHMSPLGRLYFQIFLLIWRPLKFAAGCFIFAKRNAFEAVGGFDEQFFASEEIWLSKALKQQGQFVILREPVVTSARKTRMYSHWQLFLITVRLLFLGPKAWQRREGLELWYDGRREALESGNQTTDGRG
jgi:glycosyltransferase involved in cell wall biosynthesis